MSRRHEHEPSGQIKRHCRLRDKAGPPLWVGNDADWQKILDNRSAVICDRDGCRGQLVPVKAVIRANAVVRQRHLKYPSNGGCSHHDSKPEEPIEADRGMSERHRWMQNCITAMCRAMGYSAIPEHELTDAEGVCIARADVWAEPANMAFEVQQRDTDFAGRTNDRAQGGAVQTIWMLSHDANSPSCEDALFAVPAVRFKVLDRRLPRDERWDREFEPWLDSAALDDFAVVDMWATTWQLIDEAPYLRRCKVDLGVFLREVLAGRRVWVSGDPSTPPSKYGPPDTGWVLLDDLDEVRARIARDEAEAAAAAARAEPEPPEPDVPGAAGEGRDALPAAPPPPPRPPAPTPKPATPAPASAPPAAPRPALRLAEPEPTDEVDWGFWLKAVGVIVGVLLIGLCVWKVCAEVSHAVDWFEAWWDNFFHPHVPTYDPCRRGNPFC